MRQKFSETQLMLGEKEGGAFVLVRAQEVRKCLMGTIQ